MPKISFFKTIQLLLTCLLSLSSPLLFADEAEQQADIFIPTPQSHAFSVGVEYTNLINRSMNPNALDDLETLEIKQSNQIGASLSYKAFENEKTQLNLVGKIGMADLQLEVRDNFFHQFATLTYDPAPMFGIGFNTSYKINESTGLQLNSLYKKWSPKINSASFLNESGFNFSGQKNAKVSDFQAAILINRTFYMGANKTLKLTPSIGPVLSFTDIRTSNINYETANNFVTDTDHGGNQDNILGMILGLDLTDPNESMRLHIEFHFFSETALTLSFHYNF